MTEFVFGSLSTVEKRLAYLQTARQGVKHRDQVKPRAPRAHDAPVLTTTIALPETVERVVCKVSQPKTAVYPFHLVTIKWDLLNWQYMQVWQATLPAQPEGTIVRYTIEAYLPGNESPLLADEGTTFSYLVGDPTPPAWSLESITYQVFPDRFYPGNGRSWHETTSLNDIHGGTLRGIMDKLDYIADMGFNTIWLNPFFPDESHHGYHATDYFSINPRLGTMEDMQELVTAAHERGIRLLLDFVANHWGSNHHTFQEAIKDPISPYVDWYHWIDYPDDYHTFFGVMDLPKVNVDHPAVRDYLIRSVRFWLHEIGFDGLRLDYALGPTHDFWTIFRAEVKKIKPDAWMFGEVVETPTTILSYEGRLDGCLDFPLMQIMRDVFALEDVSLTAFDTFLNNHEQFFPQSFSLPSFLDNHDMNRFSWIAKNDNRKLKVASLCQFTLSAPPIIYNGTEVGVQQKMGMGDPGSQGMEENRQPMLWGTEQDGALRDFFQQLIHMRRANPVLIHGKRQTVHLDAAAKTYAYVRFDGKAWMLVCLNLNESPQTFTVKHMETGLDQTVTLQGWQGMAINQDGKTLNTIV